VQRCSLQGSATAAHFAAARRALEQLPSDDSAATINSGCIAFKEGRVQDALAAFNEASAVLGSTVGDGAQGF